MAKEKQTANSNGYKFAIVGLIIVIAILLFTLFIKNPQSSNYASTSVTTATYTTATTTISSFVTSNLTLINASYTFSLGSVNSVQPSYFVVYFQLPINATAINVTGSFVSNNKVMASIINAQQYGEIMGLTNCYSNGEFVTTQQQCSAETNSMIAGVETILNISGHSLGNTTGANIHEDLYSTYPPFASAHICNTTSTSSKLPFLTYPSWADCSEFNPASTQYALVFADSNQNLNDTISISTPIKVTYTTS
jgi:hypothetical protein